MINLKTFAEAIFSNNSDYNSITDTDKSDIFFIFNQYMAKKLPLQAQYFNTKGINKATACDYWKKYNSSTIGIPFWFWKGKRTLEKNDEDILLEKICQEYNLDKYDIFYLKNTEKELYLQLINEYNESNDLLNNTKTKIKKNETKPTKRRK